LAAKGAKGAKKESEFCRGDRRVAILYGTPQEEIRIRKNNLKVRKKEFRNVGAGLKPALLASW
jgi:hypothetical protein